MYKRISSVNFSSLSFNDDIDNQFKNFTNKFITEFESSILESSEFDISPCENEREILRKIVNPSHVFPIEIDSKTGLEILDELLTIKLEEYLAMPLNDLKNDNQKVELKELASFEEYIRKKDNYSKDYLSKQMKELKVADDSCFCRTPYFLLYKARNIVAREVQNRRYSIKALNKFVLKLQENFEVYLYNKLITDNLIRLNDGDKKSIYQRLEHELLNDFINNFRLGKTEEEGNKLVLDIKSKLEETSISERIKDIMWSAYVNELGGGKADDLLVDWTKTFKKELEKNFIILKMVNDDEDLDFVHFPMAADSIKKIILGSILNENNFAVLIQSAFQGIKNEEKTKFINLLYEKYLLKSSFSVALCVKNVKTDEVLLNSKLNPDITVMSNEVFKSWQYELYPDEDARTVFLDYDVHENLTWFIVDDVQCAVSDVDQAYYIAREKLINLLNFLFHFISREDQINYEIVDPYLVFNRDTKRVTIGRMSHPGIDPKNIDDLEIDLLRFTNNFFKVHSFERDLVIKAINYYIKACKTDDVEEKMRFQSEICKTIFQTHVIKELSVNCAIIIAGTNYDKDDVNYGEMRRWLVEDFHEFFYFADRVGFIPLKMRITERFMVFCKIIIRTILFNLIPINKDSQYSVNDVIEWILTINPNKDSIARRNK